MRDELALTLVATKDSGPVRRHRAWLRSSELVCCPHCATRYWLTIRPTSDTGRQTDLGIVEALRLLGQIVEAEHEIGHSSAMLSVPYGRQGITVV